MTPLRYDALVIGAGPAGSTVAALLARAGWSVAIVEKSPFPRRKVCGEFVSATNAPLFDALGIGDVFRGAAGPEVRRVGVFAKDAALAAEMPAVGGGPAAWGRALGRETLDALLLDCALARGARAWQPYAAVELRRHEEFTECRIAARPEGRSAASQPAAPREAETVLRAPIVVAAHGSWERGSLPTQRAGPRDNGRRGISAHRASDLFAFKAHFAGSGLAEDLMSLLAFPGGYGGIVQGDRGRAVFSCCIRRDALLECRRRAPRQRAGAAVLAHVLRACSGVRDALQSASLEGAWLAAGPLQPGMRPRYANGVFLAGNAAGEAHPIVAEGISMAMQSAALLAAQLIGSQDGLAAAGAVEQAGTAYADEWHARFATRLHAAALFAHLAMREHSAAALLPVLRRFPALLTFGAQLSGKTHTLH